MQEIYLERNQHVLCQCITYVSLFTGVTTISGLVYTFSQGGDPAAY